MLYKIFMLASSSQERTAGGETAIIGIANSLDLTEKFLPLLAAQGRSPSSVHFPPFQAEEIVAIVKERLSALYPRYDVEHVMPMQEDDGIPAPLGVAPVPVNGQSAAEEIPIFTLPALQLAAKRVAAVQGDIRRALDACRLAVELLENEQRQKALDAVADGIDAPPQYSAQKLLAEWTPASAPKVGMQHVLKVLPSATKSPHTEKIRNLRINAKLLLAAYYVARQRFSAGLSVLGSADAGMQRMGSPFGVALVDLETTYRTMLSNDDGTFQPCPSSEIQTILDSQMDGIVELSGGAKAAGMSMAAKRASKKQGLAIERNVTCRVPEDELLAGLTTMPRAAATNATTSSGGSLAASEAVRGMIRTEKARIERNRGWDDIAKQQHDLRMQELGGGRGAIAYGL